MVPRRIRMLGGRMGRLAIALVVAGLLMVLTGPRLHHAMKPTPVPAGTGPASFAPRSPAYSHLTADVEDAPLGRAVALFEQGTGVELFDFPQALVLGADKTSTRRITRALDRGGPWTDEPGPMLLSPDGRLVVLGTYDQRKTDLAVIDLARGTVDLVPVPASDNLHPLAWSRDGAKIAYTAGETLLLLDLTSGSTRELPGGRTAVGAAFTPVYGELAVEIAGSSPRQVRVLDEAGGVDRLLSLHRGPHPPASDPWAPWHSLSPEAWSPDGGLLAMDDGESRVAFMRSDGAYAGAPAPVNIPHTGKGYHGHFAGWSAPDRLILMTGPGTGPEGGDATLRETDLHGQDDRLLTRISTHDGNEAVWRVQLASGILAGHFARRSGALDTGPWPRWIIIKVMGYAVIVLGVLVMLLGRWSRDNRPPRMRPE